jgi:type VI protein secretion system component VasF
MTTAEAQLNARREAVRTAIREYKEALQEARRTAVTGDAAHYGVCLTQLDSAKRVLWFED